MKTNETIEANKIIAEFMGGKEVDWFSERIIIYPYSDNLTMHNYITEASAYILDIDVRFDSSWDWLMPVIRKINNLDKATQFSIFKTYASCTVEKGGKFYKDFSFSHAEYITAEQTDIQACWKLVVRFISWFNEKKIEKDLVVTE